MTRISLLFVILALFAVGCGLSEASENTTAFMSQDLSQDQKGTTPDIEVAVESVKCDVHPFADSNEAGVTCQLEVVEDALLWVQSKEPFIIFASGTLKVTDSKFSFGATQSFGLTGSGSINTCALESEWEEGLFYPCGLPFWAFSPDLKSVVVNSEAPSANLLSEVPFDITFTAMAYTQAPIKDSLIIQGGLTFNLTACQGMLIPNSSVASIIMIGELKDSDSPVVVLGSFDSDMENPDVIGRFECDQYANQEVSYVKDGDGYVAVMTHPLSLKMDDETVREVKSNIIVTTEAMVFDAPDGFIIYAE